MFSSSERSRPAATASDLETPCVCARRPSQASYLARKQYWGEFVLYSCARECLHLLAYSSPLHGAASLRQAACLVR